MGNAGGRIMLKDGTDVGEANDAGREFARAIARMHSMLANCDAELAGLSDAASEHGQASEAFQTALRRLDKCRHHRDAQTSVIESQCGGSQDSFKACVAAHSAEQAQHCLSHIHTFLDCAMQALDKNNDK